MGLDIKLEGGGDRQLLSGRVVLREGLYHKPVKLSLLPDAAPRRAAPRDDNALIPLDNWMHGAALNLAIAAHAPLVVDNNVARMDIFPDLRLGGTLARPVLTGQANARNGIIRYRRRVFEVTRGTIDFTNPYRTEAHVDVEGQTRVRQWDIFLNLTGTLNQLRFAMRSQPAQDDADIVSLLLLGRTNKEMIGAEGGAPRRPNRCWLN